MFVSACELRLRRHRQNLRAAQIALAEARVWGNAECIAKASDTVCNALTRVWHAQEMVAFHRRTREARVDELLTA